jgi:hypothetical protein
MSRSKARKTANAPSSSWIRLQSLLLRHLPTGTLLDALVLRERPNPGAIGSLPSQEVFTVLSQERNLYGQALLAAITPDIEAVLAGPNGKKDPILRALAKNPAVPEDLRLTWLRDAAAKGDTRWGLALLVGAPDLFATLATGPEIAGQLSVRAGQPGPELLASSAARSPAESLKAAGDAVANGASFAELFHRICQLLAVDIAADRYLADLPLVLELCRQFNRWGHSGDLPLPAYLRRTLMAGTGTDAFLALSVFQDQGEPTGTWPLHLASDFSPRAVLDATPTTFTRPGQWVVLVNSKRRRPEEGFQVHQWSDAAANFFARTIAESITTLDELLGLQALLGEWTGSVEDLISAAKLL